MVIIGRVNDTTSTHTKNLAACFNSESAHCLSKAKPKHMRSELLWTCSGKQSSDGGAVAPQRGIPGPPRSCPLRTSFPAAFISQPRLSACALSSDKLQPWHCPPHPVPICEILPYNVASSTCYLYKEWVTVGLTPKAMSSSRTGGLEITADSLWFAGCLVHLFLH